MIWIFVNLYDRYGISYDEDQQKGAYEDKGKNRS